MLVGEPGIGKTRTSEELATYAAACAARRCSGAAATRARARRLLALGRGRCAPTSTTRAEELRQGEMGRRGRHRAGRVRGERAPARHCPPPDAATRRRRASASSTPSRHSCERLEGQPLMVVLDDLHWADKPSLLLLQFLARELRGSRAAGHRHLPRRRGAAPAPAVADAGGAEPREPGSADPAARLTRDEVRALHRDPRPGPRRRRPCTGRREPRATRFFVNEVVRLLVAGRTARRLTPSPVERTIPRA